MSIVRNAPNVLAVRRVGVAHQVVLIHTLVTVNVKGAQATKRYAEIPRACDKCGNTAKFFTRHQTDTMMWMVTNYCQEYVPKNATRR